MMCSRNSMIVLNFLPESTGSYYMDAELINYVKEAYLSVKCAVATCWEEARKAYPYPVTTPGIHFFDYTMGTMDSIQAEYTCAGSKSGRGQWNRSWSHTFP